MEKKYKLMFGLLFAFTLIAGTYAVTYNYGGSVDLTQEDIDDLQQIMSDEGLTKQQLEDSLMKQSLSNKLQEDTRKMQSDLEQRLYGAEFRNADRDTKQALKQAWTEIMTNGKTCDSWS